MEYKLYSIDRTGHVISRRDFVAHDDLAALLEAEQSCAKNEIEVWQGARRVARVKLANAPLDTTDRMSL